MTTVSTIMARAIPSPSILVSAMLVKANAPVTITTSRAALTMIRPVRTSPTTMLSRLSLVRFQCSCTRVSMNTA